MAERVTTETPWSVRVSLQRAARGPVRLTLDADERERRAVAEELDLPLVERLRGEVTVIPWLDGLQVNGVWEARASQTCGVTLEPFERDFAGAFQIRAVPADSPAATPPEPEVEIDLSTPDPPDILQDDSVDVASLLVEHLALELDPFPRSPGAEFAPPPDESPTSPFAVLQRLQPRGEG